MAAGDAGGFTVDEDALRQWILKAYHESDGDDVLSGRLMDALRNFLSGPPSGPSAVRYYFEDHPESSLSRLVRELDEAYSGLSRLVFSPLVAALEQREKGQKNELAPNLSVYVASLAGPIALKSDVDETVVCALIAAGILALSKLGKETVENRLPAR